jgi:hypothetical protein
VGISADLVVRVGADLSDLQRDFARGPALAERFAEDVTRVAASAFAPPRVDEAAFSAAGTRAGRAMAGGLTGALHTDVASDLAALQGLLNEVDLGTLGPADTGAFRALAQDVRDVAAAAGASAADVAAFNAAINTIDPRACARRPARSRGSAARRRPSPKRRPRRRAASRRSPRRAAGPGSRYRTSSASSAR